MKFLSNYACEMNKPISEALISIHAEVQGSFVYTVVINTLQFHAHFDKCIYQTDCTENNPITSNMLFIGAICRVPQCILNFSVELLIVKLVE